MAFEQDKFLQELGFTPRTVPIIGTRLPGYSEIPMTASTEDAEQIVRDKIGTVSPDEFLDAIAKGDPSLTDLVNTVKADGKLAESFQNAAAKDPTFLKGLSDIANGTSTGAPIDLGKLNDTISGNGIKARMARGLLTKTLNQIADTPLEFDHLAKTYDKASRMGIDSYESFIEAMKNPDQFIAVLLEDLDIPLEYKRMIAGFIKEFAPMLGDALDHNTGFLEELKVVGKNAGAHYEAVGTPIIPGTSSPYQADVPATVTYNPTTFSSDFDSATAGINLDDWSATFDKVKEFATDAGVELDAMKDLINTDIDLQNSFRAMSNAEVKTEIAEALDKMANDDITPRQAVVGLGTPGL